MQKTVSIIMPAYKVEQFLRQCLDSVVHQTYKELEIICIDDGSPDNCGKIFDEYAAADERFVVVHKENEGLSAGWNQGMKLATGKWIAFVDTDDWIEPDYIEKLVEAAEKYDADVTLGSSYYFCTEHGKKEFTCPTDLNTVFMNGEGAEKLQTRIWLPAKGTAYTNAVVWNKLYKRSFLVQENFTFDLRLPAGCGHDNLFNFMVFGEAKTVCTAAVNGYNFRFRQTSSTRTFKPDYPAIQHIYREEAYRYIEGKKDVPDSLIKLLDFATLKSFVAAFQVCFFHPDNPADRRTVAREFAQMKKMPRFKHAIWQGKNPYMNKKQVILKYSLRQPFLFPLEILFKTNYRITSKKLVHIPYETR